MPSLLDALMGPRGAGYGVVTPLADTATAAWGPAGGAAVRGAAAGAGDALGRGAGFLPLLASSAAGAEGPDEPTRQTLLELVADPPQDAQESSISHWGLVPAVGDYISERGILGILGETATDLRRGMSRWDDRNVGPMRKALGVPHKTPAGPASDVTPSSLMEAVAGVPERRPDRYMRGQKATHQRYLDALTRLESQTMGLGGR